MLAATNSLIPRTIAFATLVGALSLSVPALAQTGFTHRLTSIVYDFDNNGQADATATLTYDGGGRVISSSYVYTTDGTPDLFNTQDDDTAQEDFVFGYDGNNLLTSSMSDRQLMGGGTESFDAVYTFTAGVLTRADFDLMFSGGTSTTFTDFSYVGANMETAATFFSPSNMELFTQTASYGGDALPDMVTNDSAGDDFETTMAWRTDGQIDSLASVTLQPPNPTPIDSGNANFLYDGAGELQSELWTNTGVQGSPYAEFLGETYRKSYSYDGSDLKVLEEIDIDDDSSVEATRTFVWASGTCVPALFWAPNGRPNFAQMSGLPYVPGTGTEWLENCGPVMLPEPGSAMSLLAGGGLIALLAQQRRQRVLKQPTRSQQR